MLNLNQEFEENFYEIARKNMIDCQLKPNHIFQETLLEAFERIPREIFVPQSKQSKAYSDQDVMLKDGRFMLNPTFFARMLAAAEIMPHDRVLDVGCATGYSSFILSLLSAQVTGVEKYSSMINKAQTLLDEYGLRWGVNVDELFFLHSPLEGDKLEVQTQFDVILFEGLIDQVPSIYVKLLGNQGRLLCFKKDQFGRVSCMKYQKIGQSFSGISIFPADVPALFIAEQAGFEF